MTHISSNGGEPEAASGVWMIDEAAGAAQPAESPGDADSVGAVLKRARLERGGKPVADIAQELRIRPHLLEALEADDYDKLPGLIYAAGFLRTYAQYLGLDGTALVERLKESGRAHTLEAQLVFPEPLEDPRIPRRPIVVMACLMALIVYGAWYGFSSRNDGAFDTVAAPGPEFQAELKARPQGAAAPVTAPAATPGEPAAAPMPAAPVEQDISRTEPEPAVAADEAQQITLKARAPAWVRIEGPDETLVVDAVLKAGQEVQAPTGRGFVMMTGNAGALQVMVDGKAVGLLGPEGAVRHHVALDQALLAANWESH